MMVQLPDNLFRQAQEQAALQHQTVEELVADALESHLRTLRGSASRPARKRGSAGAWAREFAGIAALAPGETTDDARVEHLTKKYGV
jgi:hypothetical protein